MHPGDSFASFIEQRKPLVFTRESNDPYVCNHGGILGHCVIKFSKALEMSNIPVGISGPNCDNVDDCNDDTFGDIWNVALKVEQTALVGTTELLLNFLNW